jgi:hypothetical protein
MRKTSKTPRLAPDKNGARIEKQQKMEARVKKGALPAISPGIGNRLIKGDVNSIKKFQDASPGHALFAVDPELERQMAAQAVEQNRHPQKTGTRNKEGKHIHK